MLLIKLFILFCIFSSSLYIGILISNKYVTREKELKEMKNALNMFQTKMKFTYESIPEIFQEISGKIDKSIRDIFILSSKKMKEFPAGDAWNKAIEQSNTNMTVEDKEVLKGLGRLLGKTDIEGQISEIELTKQFLDTQIDIAEKERSKNEKLYKTIGGVVGLALVIIFI